MNRSMLLAAAPFAVISDAALMVKAFTGYSDNTLTVLGVACAVIAVLLILKALGYLQMPAFSSSGRSCEASVKEVHHHHYHDEERDECDGSYSEEDLQDAREEARKEGYDDGYDQGHEQGYDAGYAECADEEASEAEELAKVIINTLKQEAEIKLKPQNYEYTPPETQVVPDGEGHKTDTDNGVPSN